VAHSWTYQEPRPAGCGCQVVFYFEEHQRDGRCYEFRLAPTCGWHAGTTFEASASRRDFVERAQWELEAAAARGFRKLPRDGAPHVGIS